MIQLQNEILNEPSTEFAGEYTLYGMQLTFGNSTNLKPDEYQNTRDNAAITQYQREMKNILKAMLQSLRRKKKTIQGQKWRGTIKAVASCMDVLQGRKNKIFVPVRLHVHVVIDGKHSRSIAGHIADYWRNREYGQVVKFQKFNYDQKGWFNGYVDEQGFMTQTATI